MQAVQWSVRPAKGTAIGAASSAAASLMYSLYEDFSDPISQPRLTRDSLTGAFAKTATSRCGSSLVRGSIPLREFTPGKVT